MSRRSCRPETGYGKERPWPRHPNVPPSVLRFWESEIPRIRPKRTEAGQRLYRRQDVELVLTIRHLLYERKFTIKGARQYLKSETAAEAPPAPPAPQTLRERILSELKAIRDLLE
ncbi:MAG: MerR family transcriptional regulator [Desulfatitalea sp.]|nr:MerR family transcriptional regulator [Desulfatitalea sp.]